ncbi:MAG: YdcF family protein [Actinomycetota bacterium]
MSFFRRHLLLTGLLLALLALLVLVTVTGVAVWQAAHTDEASRRDRVDVIAVLGAAQYGGEPSPTFRGRLEHAALLYGQGFGPRVLVLGGNRPGDLSTEAEVGRSWLVARGLADDAVFAEPVGNTTHESLRAALDFMRENDLTTVMLVSDPWHNLRIRRMARDLGLEAFVSATWRSAARSQWTRLSAYTRETFAYLYYRVLRR